MGKFEDASNFSSQNNRYSLLPFRFSKLRDDQYYLTNFVGEGVSCSREELFTFSNLELDRNSALYTKLRQKGFCVDDESNVGLDLLGVKAASRLSVLSEFTGLHMFVVTLRCEHSCPYCQVSRQNEDKGDFDMSEETAYRSIDLVFQSPSRALKIEFQGGESLLNFELIKKIVARAKEKQEGWRSLSFVIATNLAIIDNDMLSFCDEHGIDISTSLDGPAALHNKNRPRPGGNSHELAEAGIRLVQSRLGRDKVSALMTTTEESLNQPTEIIDEYLRLGLGGIFLRPLSPYGFAVKTKLYSKYRVDRWFEFYKQGLDYIIDLNKAGMFFTEFYTQTILRKMLTHTGTGYVDLMSPAGIGIAGVVYNYDGLVYASDEGRMLAESGDKTFVLGDVRKDSYEDIFTSDNLLTAIEESFTKSAPICDECAFEEYCGADPVYHHATQKDFVGNKALSEFCSRNMLIFKHLINLLEKNDEVSRILKRWALSC